MARSSSQLEGFREASRQLNEMSKATARNTGKRALNVPAVILRDEMKVRVSKRTGATEESIALTKEKARKGRPQVGVVAADIASVQLEFGNQHQAAEPFGRPAEAAKRDEMLTSFGEALKAEVDKTVIRAAKKAARG